MVELALFTTSSGDAGLDTAISAELARQVGRGSLGPVARLHRTRPILAFGRADRTSPGYPEAVATARAFGYEPVERLAGGRAAVFHAGTLAFSLALPVAEPRLGITDRFDLVAGLTRDALVSLGADARIGAVPGEYCPGSHSVNAAGRTKVAGFGQRLYPGSAHVGGVVVVEGADRIRDVLVPVYRALDLDWDPATAGAVSDEVGVDLDGVTRALSEALGHVFDVVAAPIPDGVVEAARSRADTLRPT